MFHVKIINYIIKFDVFSKMRHHVKFKNVKIFFFFFFYSKICVREKRFSKYLFEIMHSLNNSMSNYHKSNIESIK